MHGGARTHSFHSTRPAARGSSAAKSAPARGYLSFDLPGQSGRFANRYAVLCLRGGPRMNQAAQPRRSRAIARPRRAAEHPSVAHEHELRLLRSLPGLQFGAAHDFA